MILDVLERMMGKFKVNDETGCWDWTASTARGYGKVWVDGKYMLAHRFVYGDVPDGAVVMHKCDNPLCVNPDHLTHGSRRDNMLDMSSKGRAGGYRRVEDDDIYDIHILSFMDHNKTKISDIVGVSRTHVRNVLSGVTKPDIHNVFVMAGWEK